MPRIVPTVRPRCNRRQALAGAAGAALLAAWPGRMAVRGAFQDDGAIRLDGPTAPPGTARAGGRLVTGTPREPDSLHPWQASTLAAFDILDGVMDGLLRYSAAGRLQPALAESYEVNDDATEYVFTLRQGVLFHNGQEMTAADVGHAERRRDIADRMDRARQFALGHRERPPPPRRPLHLAPPV